MGLEHQVRKGVAWMGLFQIADRGIGMLSVAILARLLTPDDFGLVAMAAIFVAFLEIIRAVGFDMALIQNQSAERRHYDTAWTFYVLCGVLTSAGLLVLSVPVSYLFHEPRLVGVLAILALGSLIGGFENIGVVAFRKELAFDREFGFLLSRRLVAFAVTAGLALLFRNYWALVLAIVLGRLGGVMISYIVHPYRPRFCLSARHELFHFSKWLFLNNLNYYVEVRAAHFVLGSIGAGPLGLFSVAEQISRLPFTEVMLPVNRAVFPGYSKVAHDLTKLRAGFIKTISAVTLLALPVGLGVAATAELLVPVVLGEKWLDAIPVIKVLAVCGVCAAINSNVHFVYVALGRVRSFWTLSTVYTVTLLPLVIGLTMTSGAWGAGVAHLITAAVCLPLFLGAVSQVLQLPRWQFLECFWRPLIATAVMYAVVRMGFSVVDEGSIFAGFAALLALVILGMFTYSVVLLALWLVAGRPDGAERLVLASVVQFVRRFRRPTGATRARPGRCSRDFG